MSILNFNVQPAGQSNLLPQKITVQSNDNSSAVIVAGYLNPIVEQGFPIYNGDFAFVSYNGGSAIYTAAISNGIVTLTEYGVGSGGTVTFTAPSIANQAAIWSNTTGNLENGGVLGTAASKAASNAALSTVASTAGSGFSIGHVVTAADTAGTLSDGGVLGTAASKAASNAALSTVASTAGSGFTIGHVLTAADTAGTLADGGVLGTAAAKNVTNGGDSLVVSTSGAVSMNSIPEFVDSNGSIGNSGIPAASVQLNTNIKAAVSGNISATPSLTSAPVTVAGLTTSSVVVASIVDSTGAAYIAKVTAGTGSFTVDTSADPGITLIISYVVFIAPQ